MLPRATRARRSKCAKVGSLPLPNWPHHDSSTTRDVLTLDVFSDEQ